MSMCRWTFVLTFALLFASNIVRTMALGYIPNISAKGVRGRNSHASDGDSREKSSMRKLEDEQLILVEPKPHTMTEDDVDDDGRSKRAVTALKERVWNNATIPYVIGDRITADIRQHIYQAMGQWEKYTCIRFINRTRQHDYLLFNPGPCGCCSFVGRRGGRQDVSLSPHCAMFGVVLHELGHVIGFWHEHSRPDRDKYIDILTENIVLDKIENFAQKPETDIDSLGQTYDYSSIMHYRKNTFSKNLKNTILPKKFNVYIGQRDSLSAGDILQANLLYECPKPVCYEEFTATRGSFKTPNFPLNYNKDHNCTWLIHTRPGEEVVLGFKDFDIENSPNCSFDYIEIREGIDVTGKLIGRLCGRGLPGYFQSSTSLWIQFVSDGVYTRKGFLAKYTKSMKTPDDVILGGSGSGGWEMSAYNTLPRSTRLTTYNANCNLEFLQANGDFLTPLVPVMYHGNELHCSWTINGGTKASRIVIEIHHSDITKTAGNCIGAVYQQLTNQQRHRGHVFSNIYESNQSKQHWGNDSNTEKYGSVRYDCRSTERLVLDTRTAIVQWSSNMHPPFTASYIIDYDECALGVSKCDHYCANTIEAYTCSCRSGFTLHHGGHKCYPKAIDTLHRCGGNLTSQTGVLHAGTEPVEDCDYYIHHPPLSRIQLTFTKFAVPSAISGNGTCLDSYVEVLSGNSRHSKGRFCGMKRPPVITSSSSVLTVRTHTNLHKVFAMPYFSAKYFVMESQNSQGRCFYKLKAHRGVISSPDFPKAYEPDTFCVWRVTARKGEQIQMVFDSIDIEKTKLCSFDYVEVFDGKHVSSNLLGRYCGRHIPFPIISTGKHLRILFVTDGSGSGRGFQAHFNTMS